MTDVSLADTNDYFSDDHHDANITQVASNIALLCFVNMNSIASIGALALGSLLLICSFRSVWSENEESSQELSSDCDVAMKNFEHVVNNMQLDRVHAAMYHALRLCGLDQQSSQELLNLVSDYVSGSSTYSQIMDVVQQNPQLYQFVLHMSRQQMGMTEQDSGFISDKMRREYRLLVKSGAFDSPQKTSTPIFTSTLVPSTTPILTSTLVPSTTPIPTETLAPSTTPIPTGTLVPSTTSTPVIIPTTLATSSVTEEDKSDCGLQNDVETTQTPLEPKAFTKSEETNLGKLNTIMEPFQIEMQDSSSSRKKLSIKVLSNGEPQYLDLFVSSLKK